MFEFLKVIHKMQRFDAASYSLCHPLPKKFFFQKSWEKTKKIGDQSFSQLTIFPNALNLIKPNHHLKATYPST